MEGSTKARNVERRNVEGWNGKPGRRNRKLGTWNAGTENMEHWNGETENSERWNGGTENPERWNEKTGTPEQKARNAFLNSFLL